jgi:hypothetical protein
VSSYWWTAGSGLVELRFESLEQAQSCFHSGPCDGDVLALSQEPGMYAQLMSLDYSAVRRELAEYGAWDAIELSDHAANLQRLLWIAASDVAEQPENYAED